MQTSVLSNNHTQSGEVDGKFKLFRQGALAVSPLCIAVIPWGLLAGSFALKTGLDVFQSQGLSALVFAGSAQLVAIGLINTGAGLATILLTTLFISSRHFLYGLTLRNSISPLPVCWRLLLGFLLTDELFAVCGNQSPETFNRWYALGSGGWFYICWNLATFVGIVAGKFIPNLDSLGLDFAIAATFIAIVIPAIKKLPIFISVLVALFLSVLFRAFSLEGGLMIASLFAIIAGYGCEKIFEKQKNELGEKR